jgi:hypothetical protein
MKVQGTTRLMTARLALVIGLLGLVWLAAGLVQPGPSQASETAEAPSFTSTPVTAANEGVPYTYYVTVTDADRPRDTLTITALTKPDWLTLAQTSNYEATLSGTPASEDVGMHVVVLEVVDSEELSATQSFSLTVNGAPSFTSTPVTAASQAALYTYNVATTDPDLPDDTLNITAPTKPTWLTLTQTGTSTATLTGTPTNADIGNHAVMLRVTDSGGLSATQSFTVSVANVNDPPSFISPPVTAANQDELYTYNVVTTDPDLIHGETLTITALTKPDWLTLAQTSNYEATLSGTPASEDVGMHVVVLEVVDSEELSATQSFSLTVNGAPSFTSTPVTAASQAALYTYNVATTDPDLPDDTLNITAPTKPTWLTLTQTGISTATLTGTPTNADVGNHNVVLRVTDSGGLFATQSFTVSVANVNDPPSFTSTPVTTASQDDLYTYNVVTTDPDLIHGDKITITAPTWPAWLTLTQTGTSTATLTGTPTNADVGNHNVVLEVVDSEELSATQSFTVTVANVNDPPSFTSTPVTAANQGVLYTYNVVTTDPDLIHGETLTITATRPTWLTLTQTGNGTARLSGTPTSAHVGNNAVVLRVTDSGGLFTTQSFTIRVNSPPVLNPLPDQELEANSRLDPPLNLWSYAYDLEDTYANLVFSILSSSKPAAGVRIVDNQYLAIEPEPDFWGISDVEVQVRDTGSLAATRTFRVRVLRPNYPPRWLEDLPDQTLGFGTSRPRAIDLWDYAWDDEDALADLAFSILSITKPDAGITLVDNQYVSIEPETGWWGISDVEIQVKDRGGLTASGSFRVTVFPSYAPVWLRDLPGVQLPMNGRAEPAFDLWEYAYDAEDATEDLSFRLRNISDPGAGVSVEGQRWVHVVPLWGWTGQAEVEIEVEDTDGLTATTTFVVTVTYDGYRVFLPAVHKGHQAPAGAWHPAGIAARARPR